MKRKSEKIETCDCLVPNIHRDNVIGHGFVDDGYYGECILPDGHKSDSHVIKLPDGKYIEWEDDYDCECCEPDEDSRCIVYGEIDEDKYKKLLKLGVYNI